MLNKYIKKKMKNILIIFSAILLISSCQSEQKKAGNMQVKGYIKSLRKGTVYLKKYTDSSAVVLDSVMLKDNTAHFNLATDISSPEVFAITLKERPKDRVLFFGEKGTINVYSELDNMELKTKVTGSKNQKKWDEYKVFMHKFNDQHLDYVAIRFNALKDKDNAKLDSINKVIEAQEKRRILYQINFAMQNKDYDIAPFVAITDLVKVRKKFLDTIYNGLAPKVKAGTYGKTLKKFISDIKE